MIIFLFKYSLIQSKTPVLSFLTFPCSMNNFIVEDDEVSSGEEFDDNTSVFYARTDREIGKTPKNRSVL